MGEGGLDASATDAQASRKSTPKTSSPSPDFELAKRRFGAPKTALKSLSGALSHTHVKVALRLVPKPKKIHLLGHMKTLKNYCKIWCFWTIRRLRMRARSHPNILLQNHHFRPPKCSKILQTSMSKTIICLHAIPNVFKSISYSKYASFWHPKLLENSFKIGLAGRTLSKRLQEAVKWLQRVSHGAPKGRARPSKTAKTAVERASRLLLRRS